MRFQELVAGEQQSWVQVRRLGPHSCHLGQITVSLDLPFFLSKRKYLPISQNHSLKIISDKKWQIYHQSFSELYGIWKNEHFVICIYELIQDRDLFKTRDPACKIARDPDPFAPRDPRLPPLHRHGQDPRLCHAAAGRTHQCTFR